MDETEDKLKKISADLYKVKQALDTVNKLGIHKDILIAYIKYRSGMGIADIKEMLYLQEEFYSKLTISIRENKKES